MSCRRVEVHRVWGACLVKVEISTQVRAHAQQAGESLSFKILASSLRLISFKLAAAVHTVENEMNVYVVEYRTRAAVFNPYDKRKEE